MNFHPRGKCRAQILPPLWHLAHRPSPPLRAPSLTDIHNIYFFFDWSHFACISYLPSIPGAKSPRQQNQQNRKWLPRRTLTRPVPPRPRSTRSALRSRRVTSRTSRSVSSDSGGGEWGGVGVGWVVVGRVLGAGVELHARCVSPSYLCTANPVPMF